MMRVRRTKTCTIDGCEKPQDACGYCAMHYKRQQRNGDPLAVKRIYNPAAKRSWLEAVAADVSHAECVIWPWTTGRQGYGQVRWNGPHRAAHSVVLELATGQRPPKQFALHSCDNPPCVNPNHLRWGTKRDNSDDKVARHRQSRTRGAASGTAKLTWPQVRAIRARYAAGGITHRRLAAEYGVSSTTVSNILIEASWHPDADPNIRALRTAAELMAEVAA